MEKKLSDFQSRIRPDKKNHEKKKVLIFYYVR